MVASSYGDQLAIIRQVFYPIKRKGKAKQLFFGVDGITNDEAEYLFLAVQEFNFKHCRPFLVPHPKEKNAKRSSNPCGGVPINS